MPDGNKTAAGPSPEWKCNHCSNQRPNWHKRDTCTGCGGPRTKAQAAIAASWQRKVVGEGFFAPGSPWRKDKADTADGEGERKPKIAGANKKKKRTGRGR